MWFLFILNLYLIVYVNIFNEHVHWLVIQPSGCNELFYLITTTQWAVLTITQPHSGRLIASSTLSRPTERPYHNGIPPASPHLQATSPTNHAATASRHVGQPRQDMQEADLVPESLMAVGIGEFSLLQLPLHIISKAYFNKFRWGDCNHNLCQALS